jgi:hypothetical protein
MRSWRIERKDANLTRFGLLWRVYDLVAVKGVSFRIPILEGHLVLSNRPWLLGGISGQSFMVQSRGTTQPRVGKGVVAPGVTLWPSLPDPVTKVFSYIRLPSLLET